MEKNNLEYISFLQLCSEIFKEQNRRDFGQEFRNFYDEQRKHFIELLLAAGVEPKLLKKVENGAFEIPIQKKEYVKSLLDEYTSKPMKSFRKKNLNSFITTN